MALMDNSEDSLGATWGGAGHDLPACPHSREAHHRLVEKPRVVPRPSLSYPGGIIRLNQQFP